MKTKLTCPVCDRPEISGDICPNCETNLSLIRMLTELPVAEPTAATAKPRRQGISAWLLASAAICLLVVGIALGGVSYAFFFQPPLVGTASQAFAQTSTLKPNPPTKKSAGGQQWQGKNFSSTSSASCGGFYYTVRRGDSLSLIALRFYGNVTEGRFKIEQANPALKHGEGSLQVGEVVFIPNRPESCP